MAFDVRTATVEDLTAVLNVLDGAALATDYERVRERVMAEDVFVAVPGDDRGCALGACVLDGEEVVAIAVRRRRQDRGIGSALVATASRERERLIASFDAGVVPFYESLGFVVRPVDDDRHVGVLDPADA